MRPLNITIRRPELNDLQTLDHFFECVLQDTFHVNRLEHLHEILAEEIRNKKKQIRDDLSSNGNLRCFLIAVYRNAIIGTIAIGPANELILQITDGACKDIMEIGSVLVHPSYQHQGIGMRLFQEITAILKQKDQQAACFDSGYPRAQAIWTKKFGTPAYLSKDYFGPNSHHMIWVLPVVQLELLMSA